MDVLEQKLSKMQANMKQQMEDYSPGGGNFEPIPDGDYSINVKVAMQLSKSKKLMVVWTLVIADGDYRGRKIFDNTVLEGNEGEGSVNQAGSHICRERMEILGKEWPEKNLKLLKQTLEEIDSEEPVVNIHLKQKQSSDGQYTNYSIYFKSDSSSAPATEEVTPDEQATPAEDSRPLIEFCAKNDINGVTDDMDDESIVASLIASEFSWKRDELSEEEIAMLEGITDGDQLIVEPEPPKPAPKALSKGKPLAKGKKK